LTEGTDYTIDYRRVNSTEAGSYPVIIAGQGSYGGYLMKTLNIASPFGMTVCENTEQSEYAPFRGLDLYEYQKTEFVIPASELTAMNGQTIKELKFHMTSFGSNWTNNFTVFMKEVDFTTFDSQSPAFSGTTDATQVFSGQPSVANQTVTFTFNNNYQYKGGNLLIGCYVENSSSWSNISFYGKTVSGACVHGSNTDNFDAVTATRYDFLPTVSFGFKDPLKSVTAHEASFQGITGYWATCYDSAYNYQLPAGAQAFTMDSAHHLYRVGTDGSIIPAGNAVVIIADESALTGVADGSGTLNLTVTNSTADIHGTNILRGGPATVSGLSGTPHVLGVAGGVFGFHQYTGASIPANKAYYVE
jgi:hypothetical protein